MKAENSVAVDIMKNSAVIFFNTYLPVPKIIQETSGFLKCFGK